MSATPLSGRPPTARPLRSAVVLGGSLAGMLAARALAEFADVVTIVERDALPEGPGRRKNLPQAQHPHALWSGGARAIEELLPGVTGRLAEAGARHLAVTTDMVVLSPQGWFRRWNESHHMVLISRCLLDAIVRAQVLHDDRIKLVERAEALGLEGTAATVTGVRVRGDEGAESVLSADLVVDATGRGSRAPAWLEALGLAAPKQREVNSGLAYASRMYRAPESAREGFPVINVQAHPREEPRPGGLSAAHRERALDGHADGHPGRRTHRRRGRLRAVRHGGAEPSRHRGVPRGRRATVQGRLHPVHREPPLLLRAFAALARRLRGRRRRARRVQPGLRARYVGRGAERPRPARGDPPPGLGHPGLARAAQKAVARPVNAAWDLATGLDVFYPGATKNGPTLRDRIIAAYANRLLYTATGNGRIARRFTDVSSLERGAHVLFAPSVLLAAMAGPLKPQLTEPPLTDEEWKAAGQARIS